MKSHKLSQTRSSNGGGFTLMEILVVVGIAAVIAAIGLVSSIGGFQRNEFGTERDLVVSLLQQARSKALSNVNESAHGVAVRPTSDPDMYVAFQDDDGTPGFSPGDTTIKIPVDTKVMHTGDTEFLFGQLSGNALTSGTLALEGVRSADEIEVTVEANGRIDWVWI